MKVKDLISKLTAFNPDLDVVVRGYEGGVDDVVVIVYKMVWKNVNTESYFGPHCPVGDWMRWADREPAESIAVAVVHLVGSRDTEYKSVPKE